MPAELLTEASRMLTAGGIVAAVAVPVGVLVWFARGSLRLLPAWKPWRTPWGAFEAVVAFLVLSVVVPDVVLLGLSRANFFQQVYGEHFPGMPAGPVPAVEASAAVVGVPAAVATHDAHEVATIVRRLWAMALALPLQLALCFAACRALYPTWRSPRPSGNEVPLGVAGWLILAPVVLVFNLAVNLVFTLVDVPPESHQLTKLGGRSALDSALFLFQASVAAPLIEEIVFRGVILSWILGGRKPRPAPDVPTAYRPWAVVLAAVLFALLPGRPGPVIFAGLLAVGLVVALGAFRSKRRTVGAVYASAAFFATAHSSVWPSPIPLFLLGLGLGWLAVRTRGVIVPAIVHGLFNAVSAVYVLRGAG